MRRMNRKMLAVVLLGALSLAGVSFAGGGLGGRDGRTPPPHVMEKYDANRDGQLDETERKALRQAKAEKRFNALDTDDSGTLSLEEFQAGAGKMGRVGKHRRR